MLSKILYKLGGEESILVDMQLNLHSLNRKLKKSNFQ